MDTSAKIDSYIEALGIKIGFDFQPNHSDVSFFLGVAFVARTAFFFPGQSGLIHSSMLPTFIIGALQIAQDLPKGCMVPLGLSG